MRKALDFIGSLVGYVIAAFIFACVICGITAGGLAIYELIASSSIGAERAEEITTHIKEDIMPFVILAITVVAFVLILFAQKWFNKAVEKTIDKLKSVFGYGVALSLFVGGLTFFGFVAALIIGGETATEICLFIKNTILPVIIYTSTTLVLLGLFIMYMRKEHALTPDKKENSKHEGEM